MDRGAWWAIVHGVAESDMTEQLTLTFFHPAQLSGLKTDSILRDMTKDGVQRIT